MLMPRQGYEALLAQVGIRLAWKKSHSCPCQWGGPLPGSPDPACQTCSGRGIYWDDASTPFMGLLTWSAGSLTPNDFGAREDQAVGQIQRGEPTITIPYNAGPSGIIWQNATLFDAFVEIDSFERYTSNLTVGGVTAVPYQQGLSIAASGAVTYYDTQTNMATPVSGYTVSGANVLLPDNFPLDTAYTVEFMANPVFVAFHSAGGYPRVRPFGAGADALPRRFQAQALDVWARARTSPGDLGPNNGV
jgi:hypothetical protein